MVRVASSDEFWKLGIFTFSVLSIINYFCVLFLHLDGRRCFLGYYRPLRYFLHVNQNWGSWSRGQYSNVCEAWQSFFFFFSLLFRSLTILDEPIAWCLTSRLGLGEYAGSGRDLLTYVGLSHRDAIYHLLVGQEFCGFALMSWFLFQGFNRF